MAKFTDRLGREWRVEILVMHLPMLRKEFGVDMKAKDWPQKLAAVIEDDAEEFVRLLGLLVDEQAKTAGISPDEFVAGFDASTLTAAAQAVEETITDFFQRSKPPMVRERMKAKASALRERIDREMTAQFETIADAAIEQAVSGILKPSAGNSPELSESTPTA